MIKLSSANVGDLIKIAYDMTDVNGAQLNSPDQLLQVKRKYEMSPYYVILTRHRPEERGIVCLWPDTLVLRPYEDRPKSDTILARAEIPRTIRKVVGFKVNPPPSGRTFRTQRRLTETQLTIMKFVRLSGREHLLVEDLQGIIDKTSVTLGQRIATPAKAIGISLANARHLTVVWEYARLSQQMIDHGLTRSYHDHRRSAENFIRAAKNEVLVGEVTQQEQDNCWDSEKDDEESSNFDGDET